MFSTSPLLAAFLCAVLVKRRGTSQPEWAGEPVGLTAQRVAAFVLAHLAIVLFVRATPHAASASGTLSAAGWLFLVFKMAPLAPILLLVPWGSWRSLGKTYFAEFAAGGVVLFTFFPSRLLEAVWPWYGQLLGRAVYFLAAPFVAHLGFVGTPDPTLTAPALDVTIAPACSGINATELFDVLIAVVATVDWNRLNKGRTFAGYFLGLGMMALGNVLRIAFFVVLGNNGFPEAVTRFHLNAGWLFFSAVFVLFLMLFYRWMLESVVDRPLSFGESPDAAST